MSDNTLLRKALEVARKHVDLQNRAEGMLDGFGGRKPRPSDADLELIDAALALPASTEQPIAANAAGQESVDVPKYETVLLAGDHGLINDASHRQAMQHEIDAHRKRADDRATATSAASQPERGLPAHVTTGFSRAEWHDKAWSLFHSKTLSDTQLAKVNMHTIRAVFDATFDALNAAGQPQAQPSITLTDSEKQDRVAAWGVLKTPLPDDIANVFDFVAKPAAQHEHGVTHAVRDNPAMRTAWEAEFEMKWEDGSKEKQLVFALGYAAANQAQSAQEPQPPCANEFVKDGCERFPEGKP